MMDLKLVDIQYLFSSADYMRGMQYYHQGRVHDLKETAKNGIPQVDGIVHGSHAYRIMFRVVQEGQMSAHCDCPRFADVGRCKHLAAAMISYVQNPPVSDLPLTDRHARMLLRSQSVL